MATDWLEQLTTPGMLLVWAIAGIILISLILVNKFGSDPVARQAQGHSPVGV
jgi:hypothetical protein